MLIGAVLSGCVTGFKEIDAGAAVGCGGERANGAVDERGSFNVEVESAGDGVTSAGCNSCGGTAVASLRCAVGLKMLIWGGFGVVYSREVADDDDGGGSGGTALTACCGGGGKFNGIDAGACVVANGFAFGCGAVVEFTGCGLLLGVDVAIDAFVSDDCKVVSLRFADGLKMPTCDVIGGT